MGQPSLVDKPAVVAGEDHERVVAQAEFVELGEHLADGQVHGLDHARIDGVLLHQPHVARVLAAPFRFQAEPLALLLVLLPQVLARHQRRVDGVEGEVGEERPVLVRLDELRRLGRQPVGQMLAGRAVGQARIAVGREVLVAAVRAAAVDAAHVDVEALVLRPPAFRPEVPLAGEERGVARGLHRLGQRRRVQRQPVGVGRGQRLGVALPLFGL